MPTTIVQAVPGVSNVTISAKSDVIRPTQYQWYRDGVMLGGSQWVVYTILNVSPEDMKAKWRVVVTGQDGSQQSPDFTLSTAPPLPPPALPGSTTSVQHAPMSPAQQAALQNAPPNAWQQNQANPPRDLKAMGFTDAQIAGMKGK
jgi:hypothetical protein